MIANVGIIHQLLAAVLVMFTMQLNVHGALSEVIADPKFSGPILNATVAVGRDAILTCMVEDLGQYKVAWLRVDTQTILTIQNHVITKNHRISILHSEHKTWQLKIKDIRESDRGFYMCQMNTDPMKSQTGYLDVVVPPDILDFPTSTDMVVNENSNITLICEAKGSPKPNITWKREGPTANHPAVVFAEGSTLPIARVDRTHMGSFLCIASNGVPPSVSKRITLIVHFSPMISIQNQLVGAYEGQSISLHCSTEAYPKSINYWTFSNNNNINNNNNILVSGGNFESILNESTYKTDMTLRIKSVGPSDFGSYKCIAKNSLGETDSTIKLYKIPKNTINSIDTQEKPYRGKARKGNSNYESNDIADDDPENAKDLMRDERNGHSIKISSKGVYTISVASMVFVSTLATTLLSVVRTTTSSL
ncbi:protein amalgam-like [Sitodiplosis mosellana]|uniref:protein amalgam-like n=1 Tax=Sitodiplosis mosellana TaxID=263140 RepID=UPI002443CC7F|nr:protein amalgam-like [Sitodiplosis mosellana]